MPFAGIHFWFCIWQFDTWECFDRSRIQHTKIGSPIPLVKQMFPNTLLEQLLIECSVVYLQRVFFQLWAKRGGGWGLGEGGWQGQQSSDWSKYMNSNVANVQSKGSKFSKQIVGLELLYASLKTFPWISEHPLTDIFQIYLVLFSYIRLISCTVWPHLARHCKPRDWVPISHWLKLLHSPQPTPPDVRFKLSSK